MTFEEFVEKLEKDFQKIIADAKKRNELVANEVNMKETLFQIECIADTARSKGRQ